MNVIWSYLVARLQEHSSQVALGALVAADLMFLHGDISAAVAGSTIAGALLTILLPAKATP